jgi:hypothetical protein
MDFTMPNLLKPDQPFCPSCGVPNNPQTNAELEDIYYRIRSPRSHIEPLSYTMDEYLDTYEPEFDDYTANWAMERNMAERGLCPTCGRPDLRGVTEDMLMDEDEAEELHEMYAMEEAERRMGC